MEPQPQTTNSKPQTIHAIAGLTYFADLENECTKTILSLCLEIALTIQKY